MAESADKRMMSKMGEKYDFDIVKRFKGQSPLYDAWLKALPACVPSDKARGDVQVRDEGTTKTDERNPYAKSR